MPIYYFDLVTSAGVAEDLAGSELPDLDAARLEAIEDARELMSIAVRLGHDISSQSLSIRSERGDLLLVVRSADAISSNNQSALPKGRFTTRFAHMGLTFSAFGLPVFRSWPRS